MNAPVLDRPPPRPRSDPTGLGDVRSAFRRETDRRWNSLRGEVRRAIIGKDILGVAPTAPVLAQPSMDKAHLFKRWLGEKLTHAVAGRGGGWMGKHLARAAGRATARVGRLVPGPSSPGDSLPPSLLVCHMASAASLASVLEDTSGEAHDAVLAGLLEHPQNGLLARATDKALLRGRARSRMLAEYSVTQAYTQATLDAYQAAGIHRVGSISEHRMRGALADATDWEALFKELGIGKPKSALALSFAKSKGEGEKLKPPKIEKWKKAFDPSLDQKQKVAHEFQSWVDHPTTPAGWDDVEGQDHSIDEPRFVIGRDSAGHSKRAASGVVMLEKDGSVWLMHPSGHYGGYNATFPKGGIDEGINPQANAIKEAYEETGLKAKIVGHLADVERTTSTTRYYLAERVGGDPKDKGKEAFAVSLAKPEHLASIADHPLDKPLIKKIVAMGKGGGVEDEPRDEKGRWTKDAELDDANPYRHPKSGRFITKQHHATIQSVAKKQKIKTRFTKLKAAGGEWDIQTAEDDRVCDICDDISTSGPYEIDEARNLIPAHPNCRCVFVPAG